MLGLRILSPGANNLEIGLSQIKERARG